MVADLLVYHPTVAHYLKFVATTVGRDKILRTLQYFARFYSWYLYRTNHPQSSIAPYNAIKKQFGLTRKLMRVGKNIEHFKAAAIAFDSKSGAAASDPILKYLAVGRQLGYGGYLSFDMVTYLNVSGIKKLSGGKRLQDNAYRAWFSGLMCSAIAGVYSLWRLRERERSLDRKVGEGAAEAKMIERERAAAKTQLVSDLCDLTIPSSALGYANFDEGIVGIAGTVSSLIGVWAIWKKTA